MTKLEDLTRSAIVSGIVPNQNVTIVDVKWHGSDVVELTYKDHQGHPQVTLKLRDDENTINIVTEGLPWSFDGDGALLRLVSEAQRIRLAYLFDPWLAVHTSLVWHGARIAFLALFLVALLRVKTVNFTQLAQGFMGKAQTQSCEKRLQRFFRDFELDYQDIAKLVAGMMDIPQPWVLSIDRTNWQFGDCVFNILMLGVVHEGVAFPLVWTMLPKKGNSNYQERIQLSAGESRPCLAA
jgi:hypothetical protein